MKKILLINKPTRLTTKSASLIGNIITTGTSNKLPNKGIIISDSSDHFPVFFSIIVEKKISILIELLNYFLYKNK